MNFRKLRNGGFELRGIREPFLSILRNLPLHPERLAEAAAPRFHPAPAPDDEELATDWKTHVEPELDRLFAEARDLVRQDLASLDEGTGPSRRLRIAPAHAEAWMHTLTQARLALAEAHQFSEAELSKPAEGRWSTPRDIARLEMDFYAALLEWIVSSAS